MRFLRSPLFWIGLGVSVGALYLAFRGLHWSEVGDALAEANYGLLAVAMLLMVASLYVRAVRWGVLFHPRRDLRRGSLFGAMNAGYAINNVLPVRIGEVARAYLIGETEQVSTVHSLSTILVERTLDTLVVVAFLVVMLPFIDAPAWARTSAPLVGAGFLVLAVLLATLHAARDRAMALVGWGVRFLPVRLRAQAEVAADSAIEGFSVLRRPAVLAEAAAWSVASWGVSVLLVYTVLRAFDLDLPFAAAVFVMCATALGMVVPSSPGYIGVFHAIAIESLVNVFDVERNRAASFALVQHAYLYVTPIVFGAWFLWRERKTWQQLRLFARGEALPEVEDESPAAEVAGAAE
jgi:uncharacterized protein (TIRG00374 family)